MTSFRHRRLATRRPNACQRAKLAARERLGDVEGEGREGEEAYLIESPLRATPEAISFRE